MEQQQQQQIDVNYVVKSYQKRVADLTNENIMMQAYIEQLEAELASLKEAKEEGKEEVK